MMLFPTDTFEYILPELAAKLASAQAAPPDPLPCDRWIARSVMQKAIRRADADLAERALANVFQYDRRSAWRALTIIALEDVGIANVALLTKIVAACRNRSWRGVVGGDWVILSELTRQLAHSTHCQAACDLLLKVTNDPSVGATADQALEHDLRYLLDSVRDVSQPISVRGALVLAAGGGLADSQQHRDPDAVFETLAESGDLTIIVSVCWATWRISRNPMALLLPLVADAYARAPSRLIRDDRMSPVQLTSGVPDYALDQFTRRGNVVARDLIDQDEELRALLHASQIAKAKWTKTVGDLLFLTEGGRVAARLVSAVGDELRLPYRWLPAVGGLGNLLPHALKLIEAKADQVAYLRAGHLSTEPWKQG